MKIICADARHPRCDDERMGHHADDNNGDNLKCKNQAAVGDRVFGLFQHIFTHGSLYTGQVFQFADCLRKFRAKSLVVNVECFFGVTCIELVDDLIFNGLVLLDTELEYDQRVRFMRDHKCFFEINNPFFRIAREIIQRFIKILWIGSLAEKGGFHQHLLFVKILDHMRQFRRRYQPVVVDRLKRFIYLVYILMFDVIGYSNQYDEGCQQ